MSGNATPPSRAESRHEPGAARRAVLLSQVAAPGEKTLGEVAERVATGVAEAETAGERAEWAERFAGWLREGLFLPSVPTLANAGRGGQLAACFVLEVEDSLDSIYATLQRAARIQQGSGGVGVDFSALRPGGTPIERSGGRAPGPVAFAELFARSAGIMALAGRRAGAHLAILRDDHPDVLEFVRARRADPGRFPNLGFALGVSDALLQAARDGTRYALRDAQGTLTSDTPADGLLEEIAGCALATGGPTLLFVDRIEADNPTPGLGRLRATNPCGEQPLLAGESCVLGSLQLPAFVDLERGVLDEERLAHATRDAVRFLDDVIDVNAHPDAGIADATRRTRKIGLGVMGLADLLLLHGLAYDEEPGRALARRVLRLIAREADAETARLGEARGAFPAWAGLGPRRRNASTRAIAPTGSLRLLAGCSPGIEPWLAPVVALETEAGALRWSDRWLEAWLVRRGASLEPVLEALGSGTPHAQLAGLDTQAQRLLRRAWELAPEAQLTMQGLMQGCVDGGVSKTIHLSVSNSPSVAAVVAWIHRARELGCKGVAFYRAPSTSPAVIDLRRGCVLCD